MSKIRIGVIGCGGMGMGIHLPSLKDIPECEVVAVCDLMKARADAAAEKFGVAHKYYLHTDLLEGEKGNLDGVV